MESEFANELNLPEGGGRAPDCWPSLAGPKLVPQQPPVVFEHTSKTKSLNPALAQMPKQTLHLLKVADLRLRHVSLSQILC